VPPDLSVVIPSHHRTDLLTLCVRSVLLHAPPRTEVLVVDDASSDWSVSTAAKALGVACLRLPQQRGFCAAANAGIHATRGGVVELLNDDAEATAGWAEAALALFGDPTVGAVAPLVLSWTPSRRHDRIDSAGDRYYHGGVAAKRGHGERLGPDHQRPRQVFGASGAGAFYRRDALRRAGCFPEGFEAYFEDVDLAFRINRAGYAILYTPAARVLHRGAASYGRLKRCVLERQSRNDERVFWRNLPRPALMRALPSHLAVLAGRACRRWREGTLAPFVCGRLRLLGEIPSLWRHRHQLEALGPATPNLWQVERSFW
jgi:GT2 family glycosyltransferase